MVFDPSMGAQEDISVGYHSEDLLRGDMMKIEDCKTVQEVESLRCYECANSGHWGWCDAPHIKCDYKNCIKEILGESKSRYTTEEHISMILDR